MSPYFSQCLSLCVFLSVTDLIVVSPSTFQRPLLLSIETMIPFNEKLYYFSLLNEIFV